MFAAVFAAVCENGVCVLGLIYWLYISVVVLCAAWVLVVKFTADMCMVYCSLRILV
jgi:hypothetical protein